MTYQIVEILSDGARRPIPGSQRGNRDDARATMDILKLVYGGSYAVVEVDG